MAPLKLVSRRLQSGRQLPELPTAPRPQASVLVSHLKIQYRLRWSNREMHEEVNMV
jgi:hypothetical protein